MPSLFQNLLLFIIQVENIQLNKVHIVICTFASPWQNLKIFTCRKVDTLLGAVKKGVFEILIQLSETFRNVTVPSSFSKFSFLLALEMKQSSFYAKKKTAGAKLA